MKRRDPLLHGLPHREPFVFVDRLIARIAGESAECAKTFPAATPFFAGHFPNAPLVPGVILAEALAQTAGLAVGQPGRTFRLAAIKAMKFPASAGPDEKIRLLARKVAVVGGLWQFDVWAAVGERTVAEGVIVLSDAQA